MSISASDPSELDAAGWLAGARRLPSPNCDARPEGAEIELIVIHNISMPPGVFDGDAVIDLLTNRLDWDAHPYYQGIRGLEVSAHIYIRRDGTLIQFVPCALRATRTLDVQYYLFHNDTTGKMVAASLLAAADRGVRVRLLIDDIDTADKELGLATLNAHPNIQVRLFNPFHTRSTSLLVRGWQALRESVRLNRRMHNMVFIADRQVVIIGGRNIVDEYFGADHDLAFIDLDVVAAGAIVNALAP